MNRSITPDHIFKVAHAFRESKTLLTAVELGADEAAAPPPLVFPEEFTSAEWTGFPVTATWQTDYRYVWDNVVDIMHPVYLHRDTQYFEAGVANRVRVTPTETGFKVNREIDAGDRDPGVHRQRRPSGSAWASTRRRPAGPAATGGSSRSPRRSTKAARR